MCTFIIWYLFSFWSECSEKSLGTVVILSLIHIGDLWLTFSSLKQLILDQTRQNRYQTVPFSMYIQCLFSCTFIIWCLTKFHLGVSVLKKRALVRLWFYHLIMHIGDLWLTFSSLKQLILDQTRQNRYQTVPFSVYILNLMFVSILEWVFWKEPWYGCNFITYTHRRLD